MEALNVTLIIPSLDPDEKLLHTIETAVEAGFDDIIIVDDGSKPENKKFFPDKSTYPQITLLTHPSNRGKGAALKTAFSYYLENRPEKDGVVTADGDGQHAASDILSCVHEMYNGEHAVILGCRDFDLPNVPKKSRLGNKITRNILRLFCGINVSDTQTGLRVIPTEYISLIMSAKGSRYEFETNMLLEINAAGIPLREVKIKTLYFEDNKASHFRPLHDSVRVYGLIIKYAAASILSSVIDVVMFLILAGLVFTSESKTDIFLCTAVARVISALTNFTLNKRVVFANKNRVLPTLIKYVCLAVPVMLCSWLLVFLLSDILKIESGSLRTLIKIPVDISLFLLSFRIQRKYVFGTIKRKHAH